MSLPATLSPMLNSMPAWFGIGAGGGAGFFIVKWLFEWASGRIDKREAAAELLQSRAEEATQTLIDRLQDRLTLTEARIEKLEQELDECRRRDAEREAEVARLKAMMQGFGEVRAHTQTVIAAEVLEMKKGGKP